MNRRDFTANLAVGALGGLIAAGGQLWIAKLLDSKSSISLSARLKLAPDQIQAGTLYFVEISLKNDGDVAEKGLYWQADFSIDDMATIDVNA